MNKSNIDTITLDKIKFSCMLAMDKQLLDSSVDVVNDWLTNRIQVITHGFLYGERQEPIIIEYPADWWEAFKKRWFSKNLLKRFPVKNITHTVEIAVLYPNLKISLPKEEHFVNIHQYINSDSDYDDE